ncbi:hypothetical protein [Mycolicibacterium mucogenicum]|nr:hypothetical protein [Mycolicibacterium mucogenicum]
MGTDHIDTAKHHLATVEGTGDNPVLFAIAHAVVSIAESLRALEETSRF